MHIQCTKKMLDFIVKPIAQKDTDDDLYAWHADYFVVDRRKLFVFMNDLTRFCVVLYGLKKADFADPTELFRRAVFVTMAMHGLNTDQVGRYVDGIDGVTFDRTKNRTMVARLNRTTIDLSWCIDGDLIADVPEQPHLAFRINDMPVGENHGKIYYWPLERMREYLRLLDAEHD